MKSTLTRRQALSISSMLFGLFFGAGNLIFPVFQGQLAGQAVWPASLGFLLTGIGLPFLGVIAMGISQSRNTQDLMAPMGQGFARSFTVLLYLLIGPLYAVPRLATISYEIGFTDLIPAQFQRLGLIIYSAFFFGLVYWLARRPSRIMDYIGKYLNPSFLVVLGLLLILALFRPLASLEDLSTYGDYSHQSALLTGFLSGYQTLDALAALAFGIVVIQSLQQLGIKEPKAIASATLRTGLTSVAMMGILYVALFFVGAYSQAAFPLASNGGVILSQVATYYLGNLGNWLLAIIAVLACLKTAIGLVTAFGETYSQLYPSLSYASFALLGTLLSFLLANLGLEQIISVTLPLLMFIYPIAIVMILLTLIDARYPIPKGQYRLTIYLTLLAAIFDGLVALPPHLGSSSIYKIIQWGFTWLPLAEIGLTWLAPALLGFVLGGLWYQWGKRRIQDER